LKRLLIAFTVLLAPLAALHADETPKSVTELWSDFDPRKDALETEVIREWKSDGMVLRYVRFRIGTFKGKPARMAAFYGFPEGTQEKLPAVMHIHGGGQRASLDEVKLLVARGYAVLSVNWGGREMEKARPGDANTDWGAVDPTQNNAPGYNSMLPGPKQFFEDREHPKNCNWYLLTLGCRRGLTFLERQPEVDPQRLGIHGWSMGGNLTMYVAGTDARVKAAAPGVGGQGWRWQPHEFIGGTVQQETIKGDVEVFRRTLSFESYAPLIRCPVLHRSGMNDFHGWIDDVYRTDALIKDQPVRHAWAPHLNHRVTPEVAVAMPLWFDHFLKGGPALPETAASELMLKTADGIPTLRVAPQATWPVAHCDIYYSLDPDPRDRFWRSAEVAREGDVFTAKLPLHAPGTQLFVFANVYYSLPKPEALSQLPQFHNTVIREVCLSTAFHSATPDELRAAAVRLTDKSSPLIEDFAHGWRDWYQLNEGNREHWQSWTHKITDPKWRGPDGAKLAITLKLAETNRLGIVVLENQYRTYRGQRRILVCEKEIFGAPGAQTILLDVADFKDVADDSPLKTWSQLDLLGIGASAQEMNPHGKFKPLPHQPATPMPWKGPPPEFMRLEWK
jgi:dienelactone hydrolase